MTIDWDKWRDMWDYIQDFTTTMKHWAPLTLNSDAEVRIEESASGTLWFQYKVGCGFALPPHNTDQVRIMCRHAKEFRELAKEKEAAVARDLDAMLEAMKP